MPEKTEYSILIIKLIGLKGTPKLVHFPFIESSRYSDAIWTIEALSNTVIGRDDEFKTGGQT